MLTFRGMLPILSVLALASCGEPAEDQLTSDVKNAVALCSSGIEISKTAEAKLVANIKGILQGEQSLDASAEISSAIRGIVFTPEALENENVLKAFQTYDACVRSDLSSYL